MPWPPLIFSHFSHFSHSGVTDPSLRRPRIRKNASIAGLDRPLIFDHLPVTFCPEDGTRPPALGHAHGAETLLDEW